MSFCYQYHDGVDTDTQTVYSIQSVSLHLIKRFSRRALMIVLNDDVSFSLIYIDDKQHLFS